MLQLKAEARDFQVHWTDVEPPVSPSVISNDEVRWHLKVAPVQCFRVAAARHLSTSPWKRGLGNGMHKDLPENFHVHKDQAWLQDVCSICNKAFADQVALDSFRPALCASWTLYQIPGSLH